MNGAGFIAEGCATDFHEFCSAEHCDCACHDRAFSVDWPMIILACVMAWPVVVLTLMLLIRYL